MFVVRGNRNSGKWIQEKMFGEFPFSEFRNILDILENWKWPNENWEIGSAPMRENENLGNWESDQREFGIFLYSSAK